MTRGRAALALLAVAPGDGEAIAALAKAYGDDLRALADPIVRSLDVHRVLRIAASDGQLAVLQILASIGAPARRMLPALRDVQRHVPPEAAARIEAAMLEIRGLKE